MELYNPTAQAVDLSSMHLLLYSNGRESPSREWVLASVSIPAGGTFLLCHSSLQLPDQGDLADAGCHFGAEFGAGQINFNGNDAIVLVDGNGFILDSFGTVGIDPGPGWPVQSTSSAKDHTLVRIPSVTAGSADGQTWSQWSVLSTDDMSNMGAHSSVCPTGPGHRRAQNESPDLNSRNTLNTQVIELERAKIGQRVASPKKVDLLRRLQRDGSGDSSMQGLGVGSVYSAPGVCAPHTFQMKADAVNELCMSDEEGAVIPTVCAPACAIVFNDLYISCPSTLEETMSGSLDLMDALYTTCTRIEPRSLIDALAAAQCSVSDMHLTLLCN